VRNWLREAREKRAEYDLDARHKRVRDMKELLWKALNHDDDPDIGLMACLSVAAQFIGHSDIPMERAEAYAKATTYLSRLVEVKKSDYMRVLASKYPEILDMLEAKGNA
jgi:hypothetical protein